MHSFLDDARYRWRRMSPEERNAELAWRRENGHPWHSPTHQDAGESSYHLSAACYEHKPVIGVSCDRMREFSDELLSQLHACVDAVYAWYVLPNHYHVLFRASSMAEVAAALKRLHGRTSHRWNGQDGCRGRKVWFNFAERATRSDRHFWATMNYIHHNPVRHGYTSSWQDWPYSSASSFLEDVGRKEAARIWRRYPLLDYGAGWDDPEM